MTLFVSIAVVFFVLLVVSLVFDGIFDVFDLHIDVLGGVIGVSSIMAALAVFGGVGAYITHATNWGVGVAVGIAVAVGLIVLAIGALFTGFLARSESGVADDSKIVGSIGVVTVAIPQDGAGRIDFTHQGDRYGARAVASEPVSEGTKVVLVESIGLNEYRVLPLDLDGYAALDAEVNR